MNYMISCVVWMMKMISLASCKDYQSSPNFKNFMRNNNNVRTNFILNVDKYIILQRIKNYVSVSCGSILC